MLRISQLSRECITPRNPMINYLLENSKFMMCFLFGNKKMRIASQYKKDYYNISPVKCPDTYQQKIIFVWKCHK